MNLANLRIMQTPKSANNSRILVTGASGQLGHYLLREFNRLGQETIGWSSQARGSLFQTDLQQVELANREAILNALNTAKPQTIIHAGAMSAADDVRNDPAAGDLINVQATATIAQWAGEHDARLIYTSTDLVFDGSKSLWNELDQVNPLLEYGRTKAAAEPFVTLLPKGLVTRISLLYGPTLTSRPSFFTSTLDALRQGITRPVFVDEWRTPLTYQQTAEILCRLAVDHPEVTGILHTGGPERMTRHELIRRAAAKAGLDLSLIKPAFAAKMALAEPRPLDVSLDTTRLQKIMPDLLWE